MPETEVVNQEAATEAAVPSETGAVESQTETEATSAETAEGGDVNLWEQVAPELASELQELSPAARERYLLKRLAISLATTPATEETSVKPDSSTDNGKNLANQPIINIPQLDAGEIERVVTSAIEDGDAKSLTKILQNQMGYIQGMGQLVDRVLREQDERIDRPNKIRAEMKNVAGATEADVAVAQQLIIDGDVKKPLVALKLAVVDRQANEAKHKPTPGRTAAGSRASAIAGSERRAGTPVFTVPRTTEELREQLRREGQK